MTTELYDKELDVLLDAVFRRYGYNFAEYSRASIHRRISRFISQKGILSLFDLKHQLMNSELFFIDFLQNITVNVTEMFRDPSFFSALRKLVFPQLATYSRIRIWHAGCSTGEEAYSMAILLKEANLLERTTIYATDINPLALNKAKQGIFALKYVKEYTQNYIRVGGQAAFSDYYTAKYDNAIFEKELNKNMVFSIHNLAVDQVFNEFNLILCRNVLIYFDKNLQNRVIKLFTESLCPLGYVALGSKESMFFADARNSYTAIESNEKIFRRIH